MAGMVTAAREDRERTLRVRVWDCLWLMAAAAAVVTGLGEMILWS